MSGEENLLDIDALDLVHAARYADRGYPYELWARLRKSAPVAYVEPEGYRPFWAITKHADIVEVSRQPEIFRNEPRLTIVRKAVEEEQQGAGGADDAHAGEHGPSRASRVPKARRPLVHRLATSVSWRSE